MEMMFSIIMKAYVYAIMMDIGADGDVAYHVYRDNHHIGIVSDVDEGKALIRNDFYEMSF